MQQPCVCRSRRRARRVGRALSATRPTGALAAAFALAVAAAPARAVINSGLTANTDGTGVAGFDHVGKTGSGSGVYLGNGWVLTAAHVGAGTFNLNGANYAALAGSAVHIVDPVNNHFADLTLFRLADPTGLQSLTPVTLATTSPLLNTTINIIGYGYWSDATNYWSVTANPDGSFTWTDLGSSSTGADFIGLNYTTRGVLRWGKEKTAIFNSGATERSDNNTVVFASAFSAGSRQTQLGTNQAIITDGDSGGGTFDANTGVLLGINDEKVAWSNQPADTAVVGNYSLFADVATYAGRITSGTSEWTGTGDGNWFDHHWSGSAPSGTAAAAHFLPYTPAANVYLHANVTLGVLDLNHPTGYTIQGLPTMTLDNGLETAVVHAAGGTQTVNVPVALAGNVAVTVDSGTLAMGSISASAARTITKQGAGTLEVDGAATLPAGSTITTSAGTLRLLGDLGTPTTRTVTVNANAATDLGTQHLAALTVGSGATARVLAGASAVTDALTIAGASDAWTGTLDVTDGAVAVAATSATHDAMRAALLNQLKSGYDGGAWDGPGITSSTAHAANAGGGVRMTVGLFDNADGLPAIAAVAGTALDGHALVLQVGIEGDLNGDGQLTVDDYLRMYSGLLNAHTGYAWGDLNYDGVVNATDFALLDANYERAHGAAATAALVAAHEAQFGAAYVQAWAAAVPEPGTLALLGAGVIGLVRRRRSEQHL